MSILLPKKIFESVSGLYKGVSKILGGPAIVNNFGRVKGTYQNCESFYLVTNF